MGSVERLLELGWGHVAAVVMQPVVVEPVDPGQGRELELVDVVPGSRGVGPVDALGLVETECVSASALSKLSATVPIEGLAPISSRRSVNRTDVN